MDALDEFVQVAWALGDATRVRILVALAERALCVCELVALTGLGQPAVSHHLAILESAALVAHAREGRWTNYHLARPSGAHRAVEALRAIASLGAQDAELVELRRRVQGLDRTRLPRSARHPARGSRR